MPDRAPRIVLVSFANPMFSMGTNILSAVLKKQGHGVSNIYFVPRIRSRQRFENFSETDYLALVDKCVELKPDIIGISVFSGFLQQAVLVTSRLREMTDALVVWGGIHPTLDPEGSLEHVDVVCRGEGEAALAELARWAGGERSMEDIDNLWIRRNGRIIKNPVKLNEELDAVPYPDMDNRDKFILAGGRIVPLERQYSFYSLMTSRGCFFSCSYCSNEALRAVYDRYRVRRRSVDDVIGEIHRALSQNPGIERLYFYDDIFTFDKKWLREFSARYRKEIGLPFFCYTHPRFVNEDVIRTVREAGCNLISMGIQGCSERMRGKFNRLTSSKDIEKAFEIITGSKFDEFYVDMIFSPFESDDDRREGLEFLLSLPKPFRLTMHSLSFLPGARLTKESLAEGLISEKDVVSCMEEPSHQLGYASGLFSSGEGRWWTLYSLCGTGWIPNGVIRLAKRLPAIPQILYLARKVVERVPLMLTKRNVFTR